MKRVTLVLFLFLSLTLFGFLANAGEPENTVDACKDGVDNDGDSHVDCSDQDCGIFAICVTPPAPKNPAPPDPEKVKDKKAEKDDDIIHRPFRLGFFPHVSTDGSNDKPVRNNFSLNFIGWGDILVGAEFGHLGNIRKLDVRGFQAAGLFNHDHGMMHGFQGAGIYNFTLKSANGFQGAGIANVSGESRGFKAAGIANVTYGGMSGFQGTGVANVARGGMSGFQGAGIANVDVGSLRGVQGAGVANVTTDSAKGLQASGVANYADAMTGAQLSGIVNVAPHAVKGAQVGLINVGGSVRGAQVGLINIATKEMKGAPIGLINYAGDGILAPTFWLSDNSLLNVGLKMGSRHIYTILGYGNHPLGGKDNRRDSIIAGLGGHVDFEPVWLEFDILSHWLRANYDWNEDGHDSIHKLRVTVGWRVMDQLSIFAGPTLNLLVSEVRDDVDLIPNIWSDKDGDINRSLTIGFIGGLQWEPKWGNLNAVGRSSAK